MEMTISMIVVLIFISFLCEYMDSSIGMGYGTTLAPILLLMDFELINIVPAILFSELVSGLLAGGMHHAEGNVDLRNIVTKKLIIVFSICGIAGVLLGHYIVFNIDKIIIKYYICILIFSIGVIMLIRIYSKSKSIFSWKRICGFGIIASFNKILSGGGYGPIITGGQVVSGVPVKNAVGITSISEGMICLMGLLFYIMFHKINNPELFISLICGSIISVPLSAKTVKIISEKTIKYLIGFMCILLSIANLIKLIA